LSGDTEAKVTRPTGATLWHGRCSSPIRMVRVLLVDDSPLARAAASKAFVERGFEAIAAGSAAEVRALQPTGLAAAVLDVELEDGDGIALATALRATDPTLPVAFLTATANARHLANAGELGAVFHKTDGLAAVTAWLVKAARR
jgi:DNA-binding response OmpR family regulator